MHTTSLTLLQRVASPEDREAWDRFVSLYSPLLLRWGQRSGLSLDEAADLAQEVFLILMKELPGFRYDPARGGFRNWLKTVTINKCRERQRRKTLATGAGGSGAILNDVTSHGDLEASWDREYDQHLVRRALEIMEAQFERKTWQACWELTVNDRKAVDVAAELSMTEAAVYVAKSRVLRRLRQEFVELLS